MYIFGYGSLINSASRKMTGQTGETIPAQVFGLVRHWCKIDDSYAVSPLAVIEGEGHVNGLLIEVSEAELKKFDHREAGYKRVAVNTDNIKTLCGSKIDRNVWVYVVSQTKPPCQNSPIVLSYVDTVLAGCLEISDTFAHDFVEQTVGWHFPLKDDRADPIYPRLAGVNQNQRLIIDSLINKVR
jgi:gamma-glutamylcyclotransferase (GGCT)/AIG2-like uncharacterized protein YtfP